MGSGLLVPQVGEPRTDRQFVPVRNEGLVEPDVDEDEGVVFPPISALDGQLGDDALPGMPGGGDDGVPVPLDGLDVVDDDEEVGDVDDVGVPIVDAGAGTVADDLDLDQLDDDERPPDRKKPRLGGTP